MKSINKKIMTGAVAASVLLGGGIVGTLHSQVFAAAAGTPASANTTGDSVSTNNEGHGKYRGFDHENNMVQEVASILNVDQTTIKDQLKQGKTLAQVAQDKGTNEDVLLQKLTDIENKSIDAAVTSGKITQAKADKEKSGLAARLKKEVENTEKNDRHEKGHFGGFADKAALTKILGVTQQELSVDLKAGQSLTDIAQAKGITKDKLISDIKDSMTDKITKFVDKKGTPKKNHNPDVNKTQPTDNSTAAN